MDTVHFDSHGGFGQVKGLARLEEHGLELQFSVHDALPGVIKTETRRLQIPLDVLSGARYCAGFLWLLPVIEPRVRDLVVLAGLPGSEQGRIKLRVKFGDRREARAFARELEAMRANSRIRMLDRTLDRMTCHLPGGEASSAVDGGPLAGPARDSQSEG